MTFLNPLNRTLDCPSHHQLDTKYNRQYGYENELRTDLDYADRYPVTILIDSSDRNFERESPGCYNIKLSRPLKNVYSIELIGGKLPGLCYNVTEHNNILGFQETEDQVANGRFYKACIPPGDYSPSALTNAVANAMNRVGNNCYKVTIDCTTKLFTICAKDDKFTGIFNLIFSDKCDYVGDAGFVDRQITTESCRGPPIQFDIKDERYGCTVPVYLKGSIGRMLGFSPTNLCGSKTYIGQRPYDLSPFDYIALFVNDFDRVQSVNAKLDGSFCIIPLDSVTNSFDTSVRNIDNIRYIKYFYPMLKEINQISIKFVDSNGNIYDFSGFNNALIFEIGCSFGQVIPRRSQLLPSAGNAC